MPSWRDARELPWANWRRLALSDHALLAAAVEQKGMVVGACWPLRDERPGALACSGRPDRSPAGPGCVDPAASLSLHAVSLDVPYPLIRIKMSKRRVELRSN